MQQKNAEPVQLSVRPDGFTPQAFRWDGALVRVLAVEAVRTYGAERRYRVLTPAGRFELSYRPGVRLWYVRRSPTRLSRALSRWGSMPRYALPLWRRRAFR
jgi:hypothetical protein